MERNDLKADGANSADGNFSVTVGSLNPSTKYYYKAYIREFNQSTSDYEYRYGSVRYFTTASNGQVMHLNHTGWLEMPAEKGNEDFFGELYGSGGNTSANRNYSFYYNYTYYASLWVAYPLSGTHKSGSASSNWSYNPAIPEGKQVNVKSNSYGTMYNNDTYSRGHQCPNADRQSNKQMNEHTYYVTNQTPQRQQKFNGSIWGSLETAVRGLVSSAADTVYVITGPAYRKVGGSETISYLTGASSSANPSSLPIPNYYWKALLKVKRNSSGSITGASAIGFWFDHRDYDSKTEKYDDFAVSVNDIESWTGFDLFTNLPPSLQETAEANSNWTTFKNF